MPVCLNCGKLIESGNYCPGCGEAGEEQVRRLLALIESDAVRPPGRSQGGKRWLVYGMLGLFALLTAVVMVITVSFTASPEFRDKLQARACRSSLERVREASARYYVDEGLYPESGPVGEEHSLVSGGYLPSAPQCPSTGREYILESSSTGVAVYCDSGLAGHSIDEP